MKKTVKIMALISVICIMMASLSGCNFIKDLRSNRIVKNEDGNLLYDGKVYIKLPECGDLYFKYDYSSDQILYIAEKDEPVLYSYFKSDYCDLSKDKILIEDYNCDVYCREDKYDSVIQRIENGFTCEKYIYTYEVYDESEDLFDYSWEEKDRLFNDSEVEMINNIFSNEDFYGL